MLTFHIIIAHVNTRIDTVYAADWFIDKAVIELLLGHECMWDPEWAIADNFTVELDWSKFSSGLLNKDWANKTRCFWTTYIKALLKA